MPAVGDKEASGDCDAEIMLGELESAVLPVGADEASGEFDVSPALGAFELPSRLGLSDACKEEMLLGLLLISGDADGELLRS